MKITYSLTIAAITAIMATGCSGGSGNPESEPMPVTPTNPAEKNLQIRISPSMADSRATDNSFETGDRVGLYVVNYNGSTPGSLVSMGNHADNVPFTYDGTWTPDSPIEWADSKTHADFYLYYPYASVSNVVAMPFSVKTDQSTEEAYKASDLMIGKASDVAPTESAVQIPVSHAMSRIQISLEAGNGFTAESLAKADVSVRINGVKCSSTVDIATASVTPSGDVTTLTPLLTDGYYKALVIPQTVDAGNLITVTVDGRDFNLSKGFTFESGKNHRFTVTLCKTSAGVNVNINPWIEDGEDGGGIAE